MKKILTISLVLSGITLVIIGPLSPMQWAKAERLNSIHDQLIAEKASVDSLNSVIQRLRSYKNIKREALRHGYRPSRTPVFPVQDIPGNSLRGNLRRGNSPASR